MMAIATIQETDSTYHDVATNEEKFRRMEQGQYWADMEDSDEEFYADVRQVPASGRPKTSGSSSKKKKKERWAHYCPDSDTETGSSNSVGCTESTAPTPRHACESELTGKTQRGSRGRAKNGAPRGAAVLPETKEMPAPKVAEKPAAPPSTGRAVKTTPSAPPAVKKADSPGSKEAAAKPAAPTTAAPAAAKMKVEEKPPSPIATNSSGGGGGGGSGGKHRRGGGGGGRGSGSSKKSSFFKIEASGGGGGGRGGAGVRMDSSRLNW